MTAPTIRWPVNFGDAILAEMALADLPLDVAVMVREAEMRGYIQGHRAALREVTLHPELLSTLGTDWRTDAMRMRRDRLTRAEECREERARERRIAENVAAGRHPGYRYRGGAVDWETGLPSGSACAWLRAKRRREAAEGLASVTTLPVRAAAPQREAAA
jgi:hypothetical protein